MNIDNILKKYDFRRKLQLLQWAILPLFLLCYFLAFKKTFGLVKSYHTNLELAMQADTKIDSMAIYDSKLKNMAAWRKQYLIDSSIMDANILATLNLSCKDLGLQFKEYKPLTTNAQSIWTRAITVQGGFIPILALVYQLEQIERICRVASVNFKKQKAGDESEELSCTLYIQNVIKK